ncbi:MAG: hypothetical protein ACXADA_18875 [Candidatus Hodarchaeales archaeon]
MSTNCRSWLGRPPLVKPARLASTYTRVLSFFQSRTRASGVHREMLSFPDHSTDYRLQIIDFSRQILYL